MTSLSFKQRAYSCTVHQGHLDAAPPKAPEGVNASEEGVTFESWLWDLTHNFEDGIIDYAVTSAEVTKDGREHLQSFVVFNESAFSEGKKPTDFLPGHWTKARSLSGARDYCAGQGIHITKPGLFNVFEWGQWIDPGWNQTLRSRLIFQMAAQMQAGDTVGNLSCHYPAAVLLVGLHNLENVQGLRGEWEKQMRPLSGTAAYYYIGRTDLARHLLEDGKWAEFVFTPEEE